MVSSAWVPEPGGEEQDAQALRDHRVGERDAGGEQHVDAAMKLTVYLRSFLRRPGVMNAQIWYSQNGLVSTAPEMTDTFRRVVNPARTWL